MCVWCTRIFAYAKCFAEIKTPATLQVSVREIYVYIRILHTEIYVQYIRCWPLTASPLPRCSWQKPSSAQQPWHKSSSSPLSRTRPRTQAPSGRFCALLIRTCLVILTPLMSDYSKLLPSCATWNASFADTQVCMCVCVCVYICKYNMYACMHALYYTHA